MRATYPVIFICTLFFSHLAFGQADSSLLANKNIRSQLIRELIFHHPPTGETKKYQGYNLLVFVDGDLEVQVSILESNFSSVPRSINQEYVNSFKKNLSEEDLIIFKHCLLVIPVLHVVDSSFEQESNVAEGINSMVPKVRFKNFGCVKFMKPILVRRTIRI